MENLNKSYCKLIHYSFNQLNPRQPFVINQCFWGQFRNYCAYVEEYSSIKEVELRILELNEEWKESDIYQNDEFSYLKIKLGNNWEDYDTIGIYDSSKWYAGNISTTSLECLEAEKQIEVNGKYDEVLSFFDPPDESCFFLSNVASKNLVLERIKEWLDTGSYIQYFSNQSGGIETKKYVARKRSPLSNQMILSIITEEIKAIGWNQKDIDRYLSEKYSKNRFSTSVSLNILDSKLSNSELKEFLAYLEQQ